MLNIYSAVYGRSIEVEDYCPSEIGEPPAFGELMNIIFPSFRNVFFVKILTNTVNVFLVLRQNAFFMELWMWWQTSVMVNKGACLP